MNVIKYTENNIKKLKLISDEEYHTYYKKSIYDVYTNCTITYDDFNEDIVWGLNKDNKYEVIGFKTEIVNYSIIAK